MSVHEKLTYSYTKHVAYPAEAVKNVTTVFGLLGSNERISEQLLRIGTSVREGSSNPMDSAVLRSGIPHINRLREEAYNLLNSDYAPEIAVKMGGEAIAAANLFHGSFDNDGMYFELNEPFLEANILPLLYANKSNALDPEYYLRRLYYQ